jgi:hypothetical protein
VFLPNYDGHGFSARPHADWEHLSTTIVTVDLSDAQQPRVRGEFEVDGERLGAWMVDGTIHVALGHSPTLEFPLDGPRDAAARTERNREIVQESTIEDWLPSYRPDAGTAGLLLDCADLSVPDELQGFDLISVVKLSLDGQGSAEVGTESGGLEPVHAMGALVHGEQVYANPDRLYVTGANWNSPLASSSDGPDGIIGDDLSYVVSTSIHAFDVTPGGPTRHAATGEVDGDIVGPSAMSMYDGVLRVVTRTSARTDAEYDDPAPPAESQLVTLTERDGVLEQIGSAGGLAEGGRVMAVAFDGATAYLSTHHDTPFYVLDLSDPTSPAVAGELMVDGYFVDMRVRNEGRGAGTATIAGLGKDTAETGLSRGTQVALIDVSDPTDPQLLDRYAEPAATNAAHRPGGYLYEPDTGHLVVSMSGHRRDPPGRIAGATVFTLHGDAITVEGLVAHGDIDIDRESTPSDVLRSWVIDGSLHTLWDDGLQVNRLDDLELQSRLSDLRDP